MQCKTGVTWVRGWADGTDTLGCTYTLEILGLLSSPQPPPTQPASRLQTSQSTLSPNIQVRASHSDASLVGGGLSETLRHFSLSDCMYPQHSSKEEEAGSKQDPQPPRGSYQQPHPLPSPPLPSPVDSAVVVTKSHYTPTHSNSIGPSDSALNWTKLRGWYCWVRPAGPLTRSVCCDLAHHHRIDPGTSRPGCVCSLYVEWDVDVYINIIYTGCFAGWQSAGDRTH